MALHAKLACTLFGLSLLALCHAQCLSPISKHCSFVDHFTGDPEKLWEKADDYANGEPFNVWWSKNNAVFNRRTGRASLFLNKRWGPRHGKKYAGGHLKSKNWYGYGCYEVRLKPALQSG